MERGGDLAVPEPGPHGRDTGGRVDIERRAAVVEQVELDVHARRVGDVVERVARAERPDAGLAGDDAGELRERPGCSTRAEE
nr:hypothetical protein GCM10025730_33070 [Promicromonospora thailandica]